MTFTQTIEYAEYDVKRLFIICLMSLVLLPCSRAQNTDVSNLSGKPTVLYFRFNESLIDSRYMNNEHALLYLDEQLSNRILMECIDSISICAYSSPEGNASHNHQLASGRARTLKDYLVRKYPGLNPHNIHTSAHAGKWAMLRGIVENDPDVPCRDEVLQILDLKTSDERIGMLVRKLNVGIPYRYISQRILPVLRNASICTVYAHTRKRLDPMPPVVPALCAETPLSTMESYFDSQPVRQATLPARRIPLFAVKTNLLFDAALMPNIEIELPIGKRWSLNGEYMFPWWLMDGDKYCLEVLAGGLEGRYWLGKRAHREVLTGHFIGLYAGGGKYDLQWREKGYQGEFFIAAGLSYGWARRIARNLHLEFNLGIGLLRTSYRHYQARDNYQTLLWQEKGNYTWLGPTKAKISLVWLLMRRKGANDK